MYYISILLEKRPKRGESCLLSNKRSDPQRAQPHKPRTIKKVDHRYHELFRRVMERVENIKAQGNRCSNIKLLKNSRECEFLPPVMVAQMTKHRCEKVTPGNCSSPTLHGPSRNEKQELIVEINIRKSNFFKCMKDLQQDKQDKQDKQGKDDETMVIAAAAFKTYVTTLKSHIFKYCNGINNHNNNNMWQPKAKRFSVDYNSNRTDKLYVITFKSEIINKTILPAILTSLYTEIDEAIGYATRKTCEEHRLFHKLMDFPEYSRNYYGMLIGQKKKFKFFWCHGYTLGVVSNKPLELKALEQGEVYVYKDINGYWVVNSRDMQPSIISLNKAVVMLKALLYKNGLYEGKKEELKKILYCDSSYRRHVKSQWIDEPIPKSMKNPHDVFDAINRMKDILLYGKKVFSERDAQSVEYDQSDSIMYTEVSLIREAAALYTKGSIIFCGEKVDGIFLPIHKTATYRWSYKDEKAKNYNKFKPEVTRMLQQMGFGYVNWMMSDTEKPDVEGKERGLYMHCNNKKQLCVSVVHNESSNEYINLDELFGEEKYKNMLKLIKIINLIKDEISKFRQKVWYKQSCSLEGRLPPGFVWVILSNCKNTLEIGEWILCNGNDIFLYGRSAMVFLYYVVGPKKLLKGISRKISATTNTKESEFMGIPSKLTQLSDIHLRHCKLENAAMSLFMTCPSKSEQHKISNKISLCLIRYYDSLFENLMLSPLISAKEGEEELTRKVAGYINSILDMFKRGLLGRALKDGYAEVVYAFIMFLRNISHTMSEELKKTTTANRFNHDRVKILIKDADELATLWALMLLTDFNDLQYEDVVSKELSTILKKNIYKKNRSFDTFSPNQLRNITKGICEYLNKFPCFVEKRMFLSTIIEAVSNFFFGEAFFPEIQDVFKSISEKGKVIYGILREYETDLMKHFFANENDITKDCKRKLVRCGRDVISGLSSEINVYEWQLLSSGDCDNFLNGRWRGCYFYRNFEDNKNICVSIVRDGKSDLFNFKYLRGAVSNDIEYDYIMNDLEKLTWPTERGNQRRHWKNLQLDEHKPIVNFIKTKYLKNKTVITENEVAEANGYIREFKFTELLKLFKKIYNSLDPKRSNLKEIQSIIKKYFSEYTRVTEPMFMEDDRIAPSIKELQNKATELAKEIHNEKNTSMDNDDYTRIKKYIGHGGAFQYHLVCDKFETILTHLQVSHSHKGLQESIINYKNAHKEIVGIIDERIKLLTGVPTLLECGITCPNCVDIRKEGTLTLKPDTPRKLKAMYAELTLGYKKIKSAGEFLKITSELRESTRYKFRELGKNVQQWKRKKWNVIGVLAQIITSIKPGNAEALKKKLELHFELATNIIEKIIILRLDFEKECRVEERRIAEGKRKAKERRIAKEKDDAFYAKFFDDANFGLYPKEEQRIPKLITPPRPTEGDLNSHLRIGRPPRRRYKKSSGVFR